MAADPPRRRRRARPRRDQSPDRRRILRCRLRPLLDQRAPARRRHRRTRPRTRRLPGVGRRNRVGTAVRHHPCAERTGRRRPARPVPVAGRPGRPAGVRPARRARRRMDAGAGRRDHLDRPVRGARVLRDAGEIPAGRLLLVDRDRPAHQRHPDRARRQRPVRAARLLRPARRAPLGDQAPAEPARGLLGPAPGAAGQGARQAGDAARAAAAGACDRAGLPARRADRRAVPGPRAGRVRREHGRLPGRRGREPRGPARAGVPGPVRHVREPDRGDRGHPVAGVRATGTGRLDDRLRQQRGRGGTRPAPAADGAAGRGIPVRLRDRVRAGRAARYGRGVLPRRTGRRLEPPARPARGHRRRTAAPSGGLPHPDPAAGPEVRHRARRRHGHRVRHPHPPRRAVFRTAARTRPARPADLHRTGRHRARRRDVPLRPHHREERALHPFLAALAGLAATAFPRSRGRHQPGTGRRARPRRRRLGGDPHAGRAGAAAGAVRRQPAPQGGDRRTRLVGRHAPARHPRPGRAGRGNEQHQRGPLRPQAGPGQRIGAAARGRLRPPPGRGDLGRELGRLARLPHHRPVTGRERGAVADPATGRPRPGARLPAGTAHRGPRPRTGHPPGVLADQRHRIRDPADRGEEHRRPPVRAPARRRTGRPRAESPGGHVHPPGRRGPHGALRRRRHRRDTVPRLPGNPRPRPAGAALGAAGLHPAPGGHRDPHRRPPARTGRATAPGRGAPAPDRPGRRPVHRGRPRGGVPRHPPPGLPVRPRGP